MNPPAPPDPDAARHVARDLARDADRDENRDDARDLDRDTDRDAVADAAEDVMNPERFRRVLWRAVALPLILMVAVAAVLLWQVQRLLDTAAWVEHTDRVIAGALEAERYAVDLQAGLRGYLLGGNPEALAPFAAARESIGGSLGDLRALVSDNPPQAARVDAMRDGVADYLSIADGALARFDAGEPMARVLGDGSGRRRMDALRGQFAELVGVETTLRDARARASRRAANTAFALGLGASAVFGAGLAVFFATQLRTVRRVFDRALSTAASREADVRRLADTLEARVGRRTAELSAERAFLQAVLDTIGEGVAACDADGRLTLFNEAMGGQLQRPSTPAPPEEWSSFYSCFEPDGRTPLPTDQLPLLRALRGEAVHNVEVVYAPPDGRQVAVLLSGGPFHDADGTLLGAVVSSRDITGRKAAERRLQQSHAELQRSNQELQDFASVASHDLQEPLRKIQAFGDRLSARHADALGEQGRDYLARMQAAAARMSTLINDLLTFSRVTSKAKPFERVDLAEVLAHVADDLQARVEREAGRIDLPDADGPHALPAVDGDATQMRQLFQNLVGNGLKFHPTDRPPVVTVRATTDGEGDGDVETVTIEVADNGIGFDEKYLDRIFDIFQRLHGRTEYEGTGIGLAVCRKIADRHGGTIAARSTPGAGATFRVTLPRRQPATDSPGGSTAAAPATFGSAA